MDTAARRVERPRGRDLLIRPVKTADADALVALFAGLDETDLYRRFFAVRMPSRRWVEHMTMIAERGGVGLVAAVARGGDLVAEAGYELLGDGQGELGMAVASGARGWLGPYLLDLLIEEAARRGVPNLVADVLVENRRMLALLGARGYAVAGHDQPPAVIRLVIGTAGREPVWPTPDGRPRLLVEAHGGRFPAEGAARQAGINLLTCPRPHPGSPPCPELSGRVCPLAAGADLVAVLTPGSTREALLAAHAALHPGLAVTTGLPRDPTRLAELATRVLPRRDLSP